MTFEEAKIQAIKNQKATKINQIFDVLEKAAELYADSQYNQALEDVRAKAKEQDWYYSDLTIDELKK